MDNYKCKLFDLKSLCKTIYSNKILSDSFNELIKIHRLQDDGTTQDLLNVISEDIIDIKHNYLYFLLYSDSVVISMARIIYSNNIGELSLVRTNKRYQNNGYATILLKYVINKCKKLNIKTIKLQVKNDIAMKLYSNLGFESTSIKYPFTKMILRLT